MSWKKVSSKYALENPWYKVRIDEVIRPDGTPGTYNVIESDGSVYVIAVDEAQRFAVVKLFRYTTGIESYEVPAGGIEDEEPLVAAKRELEEETGLIAADWKRLGELQALNGVSDAMASVYLATNLSETAAHGQAEEGISDLKWITFAEAMAMIRSDEITCAQSVAAITVAAIELNIFAA